MIVTCPSCGTSYRHSAAGAPEGTAARCSRCESVFHVARQPMYRLNRALEVSGGPLLQDPRREPAAPVLVRATLPEPPPPRLTIGMDDPSLAGALQRTALDGGTEDEARSLTYWVMERETGDGIAAVGHDGVSETSSGLPSPTAPAVNAGAQESTSTPGSVPRSRRSVLRLLAGAFLGACAGGAVVWIAGWEWPTTLGGGAAVGLLMGFWWTWRMRAN